MKMGKGRGKRYVYFTVSPIYVYILTGKLFNADELENGRQKYFYVVNFKHCMVGSGGSKWMDVVYIPCEMSTLYSGVQ